MDINVKVVEIWNDEKKIKMSMPEAALEVLEALYFHKFNETGFDYEVIHETLIKDVEK